MSRRRSERGFTLIEALIVVAIVSVIMIIAYDLIDSSVRLSLFTESHNELTIMGQNAVNNIQAELVQTRVAYEENALGQSYRGAISLNLPAGVTVMKNSLLPVFAPDGKITPDGAQRFTGNSLLIARQLEPFVVKYDHDDDTNTEEIDFLVDRYRFAYFFIAENTNEPFGGAGGSTLDLMTAQSEEYVDYLPLYGLDDPQAAIIIKRLISQGFKRAWNPGEELAKAFYELEPASDDGVFGNAIANPTISTARTHTLLRGLTGGSISGKIDYSLGFGSFPINVPIRLYAPKITTMPNFPSGFEVKVVGPGRNRQVMTRIVLMANYKAGAFQGQQASSITAARF